MKALYTLILFLLAGTTYGQSNLPACQGSDALTWDYCVGSANLDVSNTVKYIGEWSFGNANGYGTAYIINGQFKGDKYEGEFKDGKADGKGSYFYFADNQYKGNQYIGDFKNNKKHGQGTYLIVKDGKFKGEKYIGTFEFDVYSGQGTYFWANGDKVTGEFKENKLNGQGIGIFSDGRVWLGEWFDWKPNGNFIKLLSNGSVQESGIYKDDKLVASKYIDPVSFTRIPRYKTLPVVNDSLGRDDEVRLIQERLPLFEIKNTTEHKKIHPDVAVLNLINLNRLQHCTDNLLNNCVGIYTNLSGDKILGEFRDGKLSGLGVYYYLADNKFKGSKYVGEFKNGFFDGNGILILIGGLQTEGVWEKGKLASPKKITLPVKLEEILRAEQLNIIDKQYQSQDKATNRINLEINNTQPSADGDLIINIQTNSDTASLKVNGEEQGGRADGKYSVMRVARAGQETRFEIYAKDIYGNTDTKTITVSRTVVESKVTYQQLNPDRIKRQPDRDAVAVIIGISNYKSLPKADFAKDDAQVFFDYAIRALGVRPGNIKLLMDEQADAEEIYTAFKTWLPARVKSTTDVYVFYSGHGLPTQDGSGLYWLPQRANRDLISKTGILLSEINNDIQASKPKSVTIFMDACYSGQARGGETLVASARPIALKSQPTTFPSYFTVITASQADQISSSSPELQHGIFSYYLMRGMEGEADLNKDGKITLEEIQAYLSENVGRQARIMNRQQEPQVIGDGSRVLVGR